MLNNKITLSVILARKNYKGLPSKNIKNIYPTLLGNRKIL